MRHQSIRWALALALSLAGGAALAEDAIKPGLWEITSQNSGAAAAAMAQMQAQLASMPPEQRAQIEAMMAKHGMSAGSNGNMLVKACITPEMAQKGIVPVQQNGKCTTTSSRSGKTINMSYTCATQPPSSGKGEITFDSDTAYTMKMHAMQSGLPVDMTMAGRWIGADCGSIKPAGQ